jgi:teichuronic acid biosynthesis glycosyltransferase TuaC
LVRVAVVAEYYPRPSHPGLGIWAHRQALAVRERGVEVEVVALDRPLPPLHALRALLPRGRPSTAPLREWARGVRSQPRAARLDGLGVRYARFLSPPRPMSYGSWGRWAAPAVARALDEIERRGAIDLVHAHYAVPAGDASRRWIEGRARRVPLVISVHGGDLTYAAPRSEAGWNAVAGTLRSANAVIVNSTLTARGVEELIGAHERLEIVHPGADVREPEVAAYPEPTLVTVANLEPHKSQADVVRALGILKPRHPNLRYVVVGRGPEREALESLAGELGLADSVRFRGAVPHEAALGEIARSHLHVMPSRHDGFGVAHIDAMGLGRPSIGGAGTGSEDIATAGEGLVLVQPGDVYELARVIDELMSDDERRRRLGEAARRTVADHFSWQENGARTFAIYRDVTSAS